MKLVKINLDAIKCEVCGKYFDPASLGQVMKHGHNESDSMFQAILKKDIKGKKVDEDR